MLLETLQVMTLPPQHKVRNFYQLSNYQIFKKASIEGVMFIRGMGETLDNTEIKLFVLAALKEHQLYLSIFYCFFMLCSAIVNALQIMFCNSSFESTAKWETCQIFKVDRLLVCI